MLTSDILMNVYVARLISFPLATAVTWYLNRSFTFRTRNVLKASKREYVKYLIVQVGGGLLNVSVFMTLLHFFCWMDNMPILPLAVGAVFGMVFNYIFSRTWVFRGCALNE